MSISDFSIGSYNAKTPTEEPIKVDVGIYHLLFFPSHIKNVVRDLLSEKTTLVELQPDDGTRYMFYLIPLVKRLRIPNESLGQQPWRDHFIAWLSPINLGTSGGTIIELGRGAAAYIDLSSCYGNDHTRKVIAIFLDLLFKEIEELPLVPLNNYLQ